MSENIRVYGNVISPYARKVYWVLEWKGLPFESIDVVPHAESEPFAEISWLGKIPAFEDDAVALSDSSVICDYLENCHPEHAIYPQDPVERARALWFEEYADTRLQDILLRGIVVERIIKPHVRGEPTDEGRLADFLQNQLPPELDYLERALKEPTERCAKRVGEPVYLIGDALSIADLAISTGFINAKAAGLTVDPVSHPRLATYLQGLDELPLYEKRAAAEAQYMASISPPDSVS